MSGGKRRTTQLLAELRTLAKEARENLYRRVGLAAQVMADLDWIAAVHGGSDIKAAEALRDEYFHDIGGYITLGKLIQIHAKMPREEWDALRCNIAAIEVEYDRQYGPQPTKRESTHWKPIAEEQEQRADKAEAELSGSRELLDRQRTELDGLRDRVRQLELENERLKGRIEQLERSRIAA